MICITMYTMDDITNRFNDLSWNVLFRRMRTFYIRTFILCVGLLSVFSPNNTDF